MTVTDKMSLLLRRGFVFEEICDVIGLTETELSATLYEGMVAELAREMPSIRESRGVGQKQSLEIYIKTSGVRYVWQLAIRSEKELRRGIDIGPRHCQVIREFLADRCLWIGMSVDHPAILTAKQLTIER